MAALESRLSAKRGSSVRSAHLRPAVQSPSGRGKGSPNRGVSFGHLGSSDSDEGSDSQPKVGGTPAPKRRGTAFVGQVQEPTRSVGFENQMPSLAESVKEVPWEPRRATGFVFRTSPDALGTSEVPARSSVAFAPGARSSSARVSRQSTGFVRLADEGDALDSSETFDCAAAVRSIIRRFGATRRVGVLAGDMDRALAYSIGRAIGGIEGVVLFTAGESAAVEAFAHGYPHADRLFHLRPWSTPASSRGRSVAAGPDAERVKGVMLEVGEIYLVLGNDEEVGEDAKIVSQRDALVFPVRCTAQTGAWASKPVIASDTEWDAMSSATITPAATAAAAASALQRAVRFPNAANTATPTKPTTPAMTSTGGSGYSEIHGVPRTKNPEPVPVPLRSPLTWTPRNLAGHAFAAEDEVHSSLVQVEGTAPIARRGAFASGDYARGSPGSGHSPTRVVLLNPDQRLIASAERGPRAELERKLAASHVRIEQLERLVQKLEERSAEHCEERDTFVFPDREAHLCRVIEDNAADSLRVALPKNGSLPETIKAMVDHWRHCKSIDSSLAQVHNALNIDNATPDRRSSLADDAPSPSSVRSSASRRLSFTDDPSDIWASVRALQKSGESKQAVVEQIVSEFIRVVDEMRQKIQESMTRAQNLEKKMQDGAARRKEEVDAATAVLSRLVQGVHRMKENMTATPNGVQEDLGGFEAELRALHGMYTGRRHTTMVSSISESSAGPEFRRAQTDTLERLAGMSATPPSSLPPSTPRGSGISSGTGGRLPSGPATAPAGTLPAERRAETPNRRHTVAIKSVPQEEERPRTPGRRVSYAQAHGLARPRASFKAS